MPEYIALYELVLRGPNQNNISGDVVISKEEHRFSTKERNKEILKNEVKNYLSALNSAGNIGEWRFVKLSRLTEEMLRLD